MPRGDKSSYTDKQKRQAEHIEEGYEDRGVGKDEAERRAWATVNAMTHGGKKSGSGRGRDRKSVAKGWTQGRIQPIALPTFESRKEGLGDATAKRRIGDRRHGTRDTRSGVPCRNSVGP